MSEQQGVRGWWRRLRAAHVAPWDSQELLRMRVEVRALARRDQRARRVAVRRQLRQQPAGEF